jgi:hypothetical protein
MAIKREFQDIVHHGTIKGRDLLVNYIVMSKGISIQFNTLQFIMALERKEGISIHFNTLQFNMALERKYIYL